MRSFAFALLFLSSVPVPIGTGCGRAACPQTKTPVVATPVASFTEVKGWAPLRWDMTLPQARAALDEARIYYTVPVDPNARVDDEYGEADDQQPARSRHAYADVALEVAPEPANGARAPRRYQPPRANETLLLELGGGWTGTVTFQPKGQMLGIVLQSGLIDDAAAAEAVIAERKRRYGAPTNVMPSGTTQQLTWQNPTTMLLLSVWTDQSTKKWRAVEQWSRLR